MAEKSMSGRFDLGLAVDAVEGRAPRIRAKKAKKAKRRVSNLDEVIRDAVKVQEGALIKQIYTTSPLFQRTSSGTSTNTNRYIPISNETYEEHRRNGGT